MRGSGQKEGDTHVNEFNRNSEVSIEKLIDNLHEVALVSFSIYSFSACW